MLARSSLSGLAALDDLKGIDGLTGRWTRGAVWKSSLRMYAIHQLPMAADRMRFSRRPVTRTPISGQVLGNFTSYGTAQRSPFVRSLPENALHPCHPHDIKWRRHFESQ